MDKSEKTDREETRFAEMLGAIESQTPAPDRAFLKQLKKESTQSFLGAEKRHPVHERTNKMRIFKKLIPTAAAACIVAGITIAVVFLTIGNGGSSIAWADVQEQIRNARTVTFKMSMAMEGMPNVEMKLMFMEPGLMRQETTMGPSKIVGIMDIQQGKMITLMEEPKKAFIVNLTDLPEKIRKAHQEQNFLSRIKKLIEESETELGEKEINGQLVKGYKVEKGNQVIIIWADAETARPVEMKTTMFQGETEITMSNFEFDVELDESLFSLEVPEEYTVEEKEIEVKEASTEDLIEMLRLWTKVRGGTFPDAFTPGRFVKDCKDIEHGKFEDQGLTKDDGLKVAQGFAGAVVLLAQHSEAYYAGKGVKLGDAETAVFWYKPTDSDTYKVIYGDLSVKDVPEEDLPAKPDDEAGSE